MKHIQQYINENLQNDINIINEGKISLAIKKWFKKLFKPTNKEYDRFRDHGESIKKNSKEYEKLIDNEFNFKHIVHGPISYEEIKEQFDIYKGYDIELNKDHEYFEGFWVNAKVRDSIYLIDMINIKKDDDFKNLAVYEILQILIKDEFKDKINIQNIINILLDKEKDVEYNTVIGYDKIIIKEKTNKDIYNIAINKCGFKEDEQNSEKIAFYKK